MLLCLISVSGAKHLPVLLAKKIQRRPPIFLHVFGRTPSDLQLCFVQLKTLAPSARYLTFKYPVTLKPGRDLVTMVEDGPAPGRVMEGIGWVSQGAGTESNLPDKSV